MVTEVLMPQMGFDMAEAKIVGWLKKEGDSVQRGDALAEIETEKVTIEVEAYDTGVLRKIIAQPGETVPVGKVIALLEGEAVAASTIPAMSPTAHAASAVPVAAYPLIAPSSEKTKASPVARRLAEERGLDLSAITGTGPGGRITKEDVLAYAGGAKAAPAPPGPAAPTVEVATEEPEAAGRPLSPLRQVIARRMAQSNREIPQFHLTIEVDMTEAMHLRKMLNEVAEEGVRISVNDLVVKAAALALDRFPALNAFYLNDRIVLNEAIRISLAIAVEDGLVVAALPDCRGKTLAQISAAARSLVDRARSKRLRADELAEGTFTISNLGMYGTDHFIAIIVPPQCAILSVGAVAPKPAVREGQIVIADMMSVTITADHRITDGAEAARFLQEIRHLLERPTTLSE